MLKTMIVSFTMTVLILSGCAAAESNHSEAIPALPDMPFTAESLKAFADPDDYQRLFALTPFRNQKVDDRFLKDHYIEVEPRPITRRKNLVTYDLPGSIYLNNRPSSYEEETKHSYLATYGWTRQGKLMSLRKDGYLKEDWLSLAQFPELRQVAYGGFDSGSDIDIEWLTPLKNLDVLILQRRRLFHINDLCSFKQLKYFAGASSYPQEPIRFKNCQAPLTLLSYETARLDDIEVSDLPTLVHLDFSEAKIHKLAIDGNSLPNLEYLELRETQLPADLSQVNLPDSLIQLSLEKQTSTSLSQLTLPKNLKYLNLRGAQLEDYSFIATASNLESLNLVESNFIDWTLLSKFPNLKHLFIAGTPFPDDHIKIITTLAELEWLDISDSKITNVKPLLDLKKLHSLIINGLEITDYNDIPNFPNIRYLGLPNPDDGPYPQKPLPGHINRMREVSDYFNNPGGLSYFCKTDPTCTVPPWYLKD